MTYDIKADYNYTASAPFAHTWPVTGTMGMHSIRIMGMHSIRIRRVLTRQLATDA